MKRFIRIPVLVIIFLSIVGTLQAQNSQSPIYLPAGSVNGVTLIGPPPPLDSAAFQAQIAIVLWLQQTRTPEQVEFVQTTLNLERFDPILNDSLIEVDGIELKKTLDTIIAEVRADYDAIKARYNLPRPIKVNDKVHPVINVRNVAAYPSGTTIRATVYARVLSEIFPEHKDELMKLGRQVGYGRVIAGVHYPIDVTAGQKLGNAYADVIIAQPVFKEAVTKIRGN